MVLTTDSSPRPDDAVLEPGRGEHSVRGYGVAPVLVGLAVALMAYLPFLANRSFYFWDDSAAQFLPTWFYVGSELREGRLPLLDLDLWVGGNLAAEALFSLWNPVAMGVAVICSLSGDLAVAALFVKTFFMVLLALGVYALAREYGAGRGAAAIVATAAPFAGFTLYFDASLWASGLIAFSFIPHLWVVARRSASGRLNPIWVLVVGYLTVTVGNPYGVLGACLVFFALLVEFGVARRWPAVRSVLLAGAATGLCVPLVYLPLVFTSKVSWRVEQNSAVFNDGEMVPGLSDVLNLSTPSFVPWIDVPNLTVPAVYYAWFALPLAYWLSWQVVVARWRAFTGLLAVLAMVLLLVLGPSQIWFFRWPLRLVPLLLLPLGVMFAVVLSGSLRHDRWRLRTAATVVVVTVGAYLAFAARPVLLSEHAVGAVVVLALALGVVTLARWWPAAVPPAVITGTAAVLALQMVWFPANRNVADYRFPTSVEQLRADFGERYPGRTLQVAAFEVVARFEQREQIYQNVLFGSMLHVAGVRAVNTYTGLGFEAMSDSLCMNYQGSVCPDALDRAFATVQPGGPVLADLMRLDTVVVQRELYDRPVPVPVGWRIAERNDVVEVLRRITPMPWPGSMLSAVPRGAVVKSSTTVDTYTERIDLLSTGSGGWITLGRLAWPGYVASLGGRGLDTRAGPTGLLQVEVPAGARGLVEVKFRTPGLRLGTAALALGVIIAAAHGGLRWSRGRRGRPLSRQRTRG